MRRGESKIKRLAWVCTGAVLCMAGVTSAFATPLSLKLVDGNGEIMSGATIIAQSDVSKPVSATVQADGTYALNISGSKVSLVIQQPGLNSKQAIEFVLPGLSQGQTVIPIELRFDGQSFTAIMSNNTKVVAAHPSAAPSALSSLIPSKKARKIAQATGGPSKFSPSSIQLPPSPVVLAGAGCGILTITQNTDDATVDVGASASCNAGGVNRDNFYARSFDLSVGPTAGAPWTVGCIDFGVETNILDYTVTVNIYEDTNGGAPDDAAGDLVLLGTQNLLVPDGTSLTVLTVDFTAQNIVLSADSTVVFELFTPDRQVTDNGSFFVGSNSAGQSGLTYLKAADCGITAYVDTAVIGFPLMHWVMRVDLNNTGPIFGACCDDVTGVCVDNVAIANCAGRFAANTLCANLTPPCGVVLGACCLGDGTCSQTEQVNCAGNWLGANTSCANCPLVNDDCANASPIAGTGTFAFDNSTATTDGPPDPLCLDFGQDQIDNDVWFCWTDPTCAGSDVTITTVGLTGVDTRIAVYDGCTCPPTLILACNDDDPNDGLQSTLTFPAAAGPYLIRIGVFPGAPGGMGSFDISCQAPAGPANDLCADAICVADGTPFNGNSDNATGTNLSSCAGTGDTNDVWHIYTPDVTGPATISLCGSAFDTSLSIFDACGGAELVCNDDACGLQSEIVGLNLTAATPIWIRIAGFGGQTGDYTLTVTGGAGTCGSCPAGGDGDECSAPIVVGEGTFAGDTSDNTGVGTGDDTSCGFGDEIDEWYCYTASCTGMATANTCDAATAFDTTLAVFDACGGAVIACNDDFCGLQSEISWSVTAGVSYFVRVAGFNNTNGAYTLNISCSGGGGGGNDDCANAEAIAGEGLFPFDNSAATTDGLPDALCLAFGADQIDNDVWFCWTSPCTDDVTIATCGLTGVDTKIAVYDGCACPTGAGILACNDDTCGLQSQVTFAAVTGQTYLIRIGTFPGVAGGVGEFQISCGGPPPPPQCGPGAGDCFINNGTPGCDDADCCAQICAADPFCCDVTWDQICADAAIANCGGAPEGACCFGDGSCAEPVTAADCGAAGGVFQGGGTICANVNCPTAPCTEPAANCQPGDLSDAATSTDGAFIVADDFNCPGPGSINSICWWGTYASGVPGADSFTVTYYDDVGGLPGAIIGGPFSGAGLTVTGPVNTGSLIAGLVPEFEYVGTHAAVPVIGACYWVSVSNAIVGQLWFWELGIGNGRALQDGTPPDGFDAGDAILADTKWCLDITLGDPNVCLPPPAANDDCANAEAIAGEGTFAFDNSAATADGLPDPSCLAFGSDQVDNDVWFCWTAPCTSDVRLETCSLTSVDTKIAVYDGCACPATTILACNDDDCGLQSGLLFSAVMGQTYLIRIGTFPGATGGVGAFSITCVALPSNDLCADAIGPLALPSTTAGTTALATIDSGVPSPCGTSITAPGVWYTVIGTGNTITATTCNPGTAYDTKLSIFCRGCGAAICVDGNDDGSPSGDNPDPACVVDETGSAFNRASTVAWCSQAGVEYLILVHGFGTANGAFELDLSDSGATCSGAVQCVVEPTGACCAAGGTCTVETASGCAALGGAFLGDGTSCGGETTVGSASSTPAVAIPDNNPVGVSDTLTMAGSFAIEDVNISLDVTHTWVGDLIVTVEHLGTTVTIVDQPGVPTSTFGCSENNYNIVLDDEGTGGAIEDQCAPSLSSPPNYTANNPLSAFDALDSAGAWTITISDNAGGDEGTLDSWTVTFNQAGVNPCGLIGACCVGTTCTIETDTNCSALGGAFQGDGTDCGGVVVVASPSSSPAVAIPDNNPAGVSDTITMATSFTISDIDIALGVTHTWVGDLIVTVEHLGTTVTIVDQPGVPTSTFGCSENNYNIVLDDEGTGGAIEAQCEPSLSSPPNYTPESPLSAFDGLDSAGAWTITISDNAGGDEGTLDSWSVIFSAPGVNPCEQLCTPADCPPGSFSLVDNQTGIFSGWCVSTPNLPDVDIFVDTVDLASGLVVIQITKSFNNPPDPTSGLIPPILLNFVQVCDDADTVNMIIITEEAINNLTGVEWTDYHWTLFTTPVSWFDVAASAGFSIAPFTDRVYSGFLDSPTNNKAKNLEVSGGGTVSTPGAYFPGFGTGGLKIGVDLSGEVPVSFTLKQRPTIDTGPPTGACCCPAPPPGGDEGCTPGFWKNHTSLWPAGFITSDDFDAVFGVDAFNPDLTLLAALQNGGGGVNALGRHATGALLNAASAMVDYALTEAEVIAMVQAALAPGGDIEGTKDILQGFNELGCPEAGTHQHPPAESCVITTQADCNAAGGTYQGDNTGCDPDPCVIAATGACCTDGVCSIATAADCTAGGGIFQGDDTDCDIFLTGSLGNFPDAVTITAQFGTFTNLEINGDTINATGFLFTLTNTSVGDGAASSFENDPDGSFADNDVLTPVARAALASAQPYGIFRFNAHLPVGAGALTSAPSGFVVEAEGSGAGGAEVNFELDLAIPHGLLFDPTATGIDPLFTNPRNATMSFFVSTVSDNILDNLLDEDNGLPAINVGTNFAWADAGTVVTEFVAFDDLRPRGELGLLNVPCPPAAASGACCTNGVCAIALETDCTAGGGIFQGANTSCADCFACGVPSLTNDLCLDAIPAAVPSQNEGTTVGATTDNADVCGTSNTAPGVWYSVIGTGNTITVTTCNDCTDFDTKLGVFCGGCADLICVDGNDDACPGFLSTVSWCSEAGVEYLVLVHGFGTATGNFRLDVSDDGVPCATPPDCAPPPPPPVCTADFTVTAPGTFPGDTTGAGDDCDVFGGDSEDHIYQVTLPNDGVWTFALCGSAFDTKIEVGTTCCSSDIGSNDDSCAFQSSVTATLTAGTVFVTVDGFGGQTGAYTLDISKEAPPPPLSNDDCANATPLTGVGEFAFDNSAATTDGLPDALCLAFGSEVIDNDVWFCWTATCNGTATVETCLLTGVDTKIAAYDGCACPPTIILACNDDTCGLQSQISFSVIMGQSYLLRIGTFPGSAGGPGSISIACTPGGLLSTPSLALPALDIKPNTLPNAFDAQSNGVLPVGILGTADFDVAIVDIASLRLSRLDGTGGLVAPYESTTGPHTTITEVGIPDGFADLLVNFDTSVVADLLKLGELPTGTIVQLLITGSCTDGTLFKAVDSITVAPLTKGHRFVTVTSNAAGVWIDTVRSDANGDIGGFGNFLRCYGDQDYVATFTAPAIADGNLTFRRWILDGVAQPFRVRMIRVSLSSDHTLEARFVRPRRRLPGVSIQQTTGD